MSTLNLQAVTGSQDPAVSQHGSSALMITFEAKTDLPWPRVGIHFRTSNNASEDFGGHGRFPTVS